MDAANLNASASFSDLETGRSPSAPLEFDHPAIGVAERVYSYVLNPFNGERLEVADVIFENRPDGRPPERAYWVGRKLKKCIYGCVRFCTVLRFRDDRETPWEITTEKAAVKVLVLEKIRARRHTEDPLKEVAAMQFLSRDGQHPHVLGVLDVLQDDDYLLLFMPFCSSGDLLGLLKGAQRFPEDVARYWFLQILKGLSHLYQNGVCHRDISLENILVDRYERSLVIDFGMCLRVPYDGVEGVTGPVADASFGTLRRLISPLGACGKPCYIAPEILASQDPFDGFAIDLWAAGVVLFMMLVGHPPWSTAWILDGRFRMIAHEGRLTQVLEVMNCPLSPSVTDLLQRMLRHDPRDRLSLSSVSNHEWVLAGEPVGNLLPSAPQEEWRS